MGIMNKSRTNKPIRWGKPLLIEKRRLGFGINMKNQFPSNGFLVSQTSFSPFLARQKVMDRRRKITFSVNVVIRMDTN